MAKRLIGLLVWALSFLSLNAQVGPVMKHSEAVIPECDAEFKLSEVVLYDFRSLSRQEESTVAFGVKGADSDRITWSENFDTPLEGWTIVSSNSATVNWKQQQMTGIKSFASVDPDDKQSMFVEGHYRLPREEVSLTSPFVRLGNQETLSFYLGYSLNFSSYCSLELYLNKKDGSSQFIWDTTKGDSAPLNWVWRLVDVDLKVFNGEEVSFSWIFKGYQGNFALDRVRLKKAGVSDQFEIEAGTVVSFVDLSPDLPVSWNWQFPGGEPGFSKEQHPEILYKRSGVYDVTLTVNEGENSSTLCKQAFIKVVGKEPQAEIVPPAAFREVKTHLPLIAPLAHVRYTDGSANYPTEWLWQFTGVDPEGGELWVSDEESPVVSYQYRGTQYVSLLVQNEQGSSSKDLSVFVGYDGWINNYRAGDETVVFDLGDGFGYFPGSNKLKITDYAEYFSKPSQPLLLYGINLYFSKVFAEELYYQIQDIRVAVCKNENGIPGAEIGSTSWRIVDLDTPTDVALRPTLFEFSKPLKIQDDFFIVISNIPEPGETVDVRLATAAFRKEGNTAYLKTRDGWKAASSYFGKDSHTSLLLSAYVLHSVLEPFETELQVGEGRGIVEVPVFSYLGYETPVTSGESWCRITGTANGLTLDTLRIEYDDMPKEINRREAEFKVTDGLQQKSIRLVQSIATGMLEGNEVHSLSVYPSVCERELRITSDKEVKNIRIYDVQGGCVYDQIANGTDISIDVSAFLPGIYIAHINESGNHHQIRFIKK
ncbi:MAG: T9SS type A sorting domain-containing protein [Bacteroidales bacterium]